MIGYGRPPGAQARVLTPVAFQALMVTMRLTSAATCCGLNSTALARLCAVLADLR